MGDWLCPNSSSEIFLLELVLASSLSLSAAGALDARTRAHALGMVHFARTCCGIVPPCPERGRTRDMCTNPITPLTHVSLPWENGDYPFLSPFQGFSRLQSNIVIYSYTFS